MLNKLDRKIHTSKRAEFNEGERAFLSINNEGVRSHSLNFLDTSAENVSEDMILDYLARIISEMYLKEVHGITTTTTEESSHLLQSFNKGTG